MVKQGFDVMRESLPARSGKCNLISKFRNDRSLSTIPPFSRTIRRCSTAEPSPTQTVVSGARTERLRKTTAS